MFTPSHYHASKHLAEEELLLEGTCCPWCGSIVRKLIGAVQIQPKVDLLKCCACDAASASRMPTSTALDTFYNSYYNSPQSVTQDGKITIGDAHKMGRHLSKWITDSQARGYCKILDFGGGDGTLAILAAELALKLNPSIQMIEVTVVDYVDSVAQSTNPSITSKAVKVLSDLQDCAFDFVIASAVLEHIVEPAPILAQLLAKVSKGGHFYARTPYAAPFLKLFELAGKQWDLTFPAHVHDLGQSFWEGQFAAGKQKAEFRIVWSRPSIVQASFKTQFLEALVSSAFKLPWYILGRYWTLVGGWEIATKKI